LKAFAAAAALSACERVTGPAAPTVQRRRDAMDKKPRFLIVLGATGGASIIDSFLAVRASECASASTLNTFPDAAVSQVGPFRAVKYDAPNVGAIPFPVSADQNAFVTKHQSEMLVATNIGTSVNHTIAQKRSITGNAAWKGRTLQECVALEYGAGFPLPNVNMGFGGYLERGTDDSLPTACFSEPVIQPSVWPIGLHGSRGLKGVPGADLIALGRQVRDEKLDPQSVFTRRFGQSSKLAQWLEQRKNGRDIEALDLVTKLNILPDTPQTPLSDYGFGQSPDADALRAKFPNFLTDPIEGQAALAFLLLKNRVSCAVTLSPSFNVAVASQMSLSNLPLAFDYSHQDHRGCQAFMWSHVLSIADRLIDLLKAEPFDDSGESLWDRTLIYVATDFGRTRTRAADSMSFSTGHHMNNAVVIISPLVKGGTVLGGVDPNTTLLYGYDSETGAPQPGNLDSNEPTTFGGILHALDVDTMGSGLPDGKAFRKA
jgi:hypothetical protein